MYTRCEPLASSVVKDWTLDSYGSILCTKGEAIYQKINIWTGPLKRKDEREFEKETESEREVKRKENAQHEF